MANGFTPEQVLQLILDGQQGIQRQIALLVDKVDAVQNKGCSHRVDDLRRIEELEGWRTKGIVGVIALAIGILVALFRRM